jgi:hypothetical protein
MEKKFFEVENDRRVVSKLGYLDRYPIFEVPF